jgi:hypothetical protein
MSEAKADTEMTPQSGTPPSGTPPKPKPCMKTVLGIYGIAKTPNFAEFLQTFKQAFKVDAFDFNNVGVDDINKFSKEDWTMFIVEMLNNNQIEEHLICKKFEFMTTDIWDLIDKVVQNRPDFKFENSEIEKAYNNYKVEKKMSDVLAENAELKKKIETFISMMKGVEIELPKPSQ